MCCLPPTNDQLFFNADRKPTPSIVEPVEEPTYEEVQRRSRIIPKTEDPDPSPYEEPLRSITVLPQDDNTHFYNDVRNLPMENAYTLVGPITEQERKISL